MSTLTEDKSSPSGGEKAVGEDSQKKSSDAKSIQQWWEEQGADARKTWLFVGVAVACLLVTGLFEVASRPAEITEYGKVGEEFYPEFTDPTLATSLSVKVIDAEQLKPLEFSVKQAPSGRWVIPSHHDYPADAADQLAETASSVIGIKRGAMVTRWPADHTRYGVVDPETESVAVDEIEGIGKRLTLRGKDDAILASYIIGKKVDGAEDQYYVRHPGEDETYIAELDISLSTKFSDWVKTELLDIKNFDVRRVVLNDYSFEEQGRGLAMTKDVVTTLTRESSSADWKMDLLDEAIQEVDKDAIQETVNAAADLKLIGVRPKQAGLTPDLQLDRSKIRSQGDVDRIQGDLLARGFLLQPSKTNQDMLQLIAREGELSLGTEDGLRYKMYFGRVFTGSDKELEIGLTANEDGKAEKNSDNEGTKPKDKDADDSDAKPGADDSQKDDSDPPEDVTKETDDEEKADSSGKPGRYVFVRVEFDPTLLGDQPQPVEPEMPEELKEAEKKDKESGEKETEEKEAEEKETEDKAVGEKETGEKETEEKEAEEKLEKLRDEYEAAKQKYQDDVSALEEFEEKVKEGKAKAEDLNRRFAQWYYVIPGDSYDKLALSREDLIKAKETTEADSAPPSIQPADLPPGLNPPMTKEEAEAKEKESPQPGSDKADPDSPEDPSSAEEKSKPKDEAKPTDKPDDDAKPDDGAKPKENEPATDDKASDSDGNPAEPEKAPVESPSESPKATDSDS